MLNYKQIWHGIKPTKWLIKFNLTINPDALVFTLLIKIIFYYYSCQQSSCKSTFLSHPNCCLFILSLDLPHSLWFDLGTPKIILLPSPALGSEQATFRKDE